MFEWEQDWGGNKGLMHWLREIARPLGIKVGGKRVRELMDEILTNLERRKTITAATWRSLNEGVPYENNKN